MPDSPAWKTELEDGLVMRGATREDADRLAEFNTEMHSDPSEPPAWIREWTRDLISKPNPSLDLNDAIIVEDSKTGQIVSSCVYFQRNWSYCGIPVPFGRPELVSTHPDYRNRGLIRKQFDLMHRWGDERGHLVQGITGIPYYYRQFGYELALDMGTGRSISISQAPKWKEDEQRTVNLRQAERSDVPFMVQMHGHATKRSLFSPAVTASDLEYQLFDRHDDSMVAREGLIIEDESGATIGFSTFTAIFEFEAAEVSMLEFSELPMFRKYTQPFLKSLRSLIEDIPEPPEQNGKSIQRINMKLFEGHPANPFLGRAFVAGGRNYAWYMRTPNLPELLKLISPKLEERLAGTVFEELTGEKVLNFYRTGISLMFDDGHLTAVKPVKFPERKNSLAGLPDLTFLHLLFGRRTMSEISHLLVDAYANSDEDELLMDTLFPKMSSDTRMSVG